MVAGGPRGTATGSPRGPPATAAFAAIAVRPTLRDCGCASFTEGELQRAILAAPRACGYLDTMNATSRRDFLLRASSGLGGIALSGLLAQETRGADKTAGINPTARRSPLAEKKPHFEPKA